MPERPARVILAFDFGLRRIGIASGDTVSGSAGPRATVLVGNRGIDWSAIDRQIRVLCPALLLVGRPCNADGSPGAMAPFADRFAAELARRCDLPVTRVDEYASSREASERLAARRAGGLRRRRVRHEDIDGGAAAIILERWLEAQPSSGRLGA